MLNSLDNQNLKENKNNRSAEFVAKDNLGKSINKYLVSSVIALTSLTVANEALSQTTTVVSEEDGLMAVIGDAYQVDTNLPWGELEGPVLTDGFNGLIVDSTVFPNGPISVASSSEIENSYFRMYDGGSLGFREFGLINVFNISGEIIAFHNYGGGNASLYKMLPEGGPEGQDVIVLMGSGPWASLSFDDLENPDLLYLSGLNDEVAPSVLAISDLVNWNLGDDSIISNYINIVNDAGDLATSLGKEMLPVEYRGTRDASIALGTSNGDFMYIDNTNLDESFLLSNEFSLVLFEGRSMCGVGSSFNRSFVLRGENLEGDDTNIIYWLTDEGELCAQTVDFQDIPYLNVTVSLFDDAVSNGELDDECEILSNDEVEVYDLNDNLVCSLNGNGELKRCALEEGIPSHVYIRYFNGESFVNTPLSSVSGGQVIFEIPRDVEISALNTIRVSFDRSGFDSINVILDGVEVQEVVGSRAVFDNLLPGAHDLEVSAACIEGDDIIVDFLDVDIPMICSSVFEGEVLDFNADEINGVLCGGGVADTGLDDTGIADTGLNDTGVADTGLDDTGIADTGLNDTGVADTGLDDTGIVDAGLNDTNISDTVVALDIDEIDIEIGEGHVEAGMEIDTSNSLENGSIEDTGNIEGRPRSFEEEGCACSVEATQVDSRSSLLAVLGLSIGVIYRRRRR